MKKFRWLSKIFASRKERKSEVVTSESLKELKQRQLLCKAKLLKMEAERKTNPLEKELLEAKSRLAFLQSEEI
jgi:hypothetical protein